MAEENVVVRRATPEDAERIAKVLGSIVDEGKFTVLKKFSPEEERSYLQSLSDREAIFVAESGGKIVGLQSIDSPYKYSDKMEHVATIGTFVMDGFRGMGIGKRLAEATWSFAREKGYEKIVIAVLHDNERALSFYEKLGFKRVGVHKKHAKLGGEYKDEVIMEFFL